MGVARGFGDPEGSAIENRKSKIENHLGAERIEVREVTTRSDRRAFLRLPWALYGSDSLWVPPLLSAVDKTLDPNRNPFFRHAETRLYLAWRGGRPVGRIAATIDRLYNEFHSDTMGFWGFFESENDPDVARALLDRAAEDLRQHGMTQMMGPMNPSINGECGILVEGFDLPPVILMPYNPPYYADLLLAAGLRQVKELYAFLLVKEEATEDKQTIQRLERLEDAIRRRHPSLKIRTLNMRNYQAEVLELGRLFNTVRHDNWGFVPMTDEEILDMAREIKPILDPQMVVIAEIGGKIVACLLALPDINPILKKINGRLLPFGWARLLWARRSLRGMRVFGSAALPEHRRLGPVPLLFIEAIRHGHVRGYKTAELSWVAEGNLAPLRTIENAVHPKLYKRYRIYGRDLMLTER